MKLLRLMSPTGVLIVLVSEMLLELLLKLIFELALLALPPLLALLALVSPVGMSLSYSHLLLTSFFFIYICFYY